MTISVSRRGVVAMIAAAAAAPAFAADAPSVVTISAPGFQAGLSRAALDAMPQHVLTTSNEFTDGAVAFEGPLARDVLAEAMAAAPDATEAEMTAINDYKVVIPLSDFFDYDVVFALRQDGKRLSRRDKGPIWVMYPVDDFPELRQAIYDNRLIWQLKSIILR